MNAIKLNDNREITIDLNWLLDSLDADQKRELADSLACQDAIIEDVAAQLLGGWTERGSHGSRSCGAYAEPTTALDKARRELASRADEVAKAEIEDLERALTWSKAVEDHYMNAYFKLYHAWPEGMRGSMPMVGSISNANASAYEVVKKGVV